MSAEPSDHELVRHVLPQEIRAQGEGLRRVHEDTQYLREQSDIHTAALERQERRLERHGDLLGTLADQGRRHEGLLGQHTEMLRDHGQRLESIDSKLDELLRRLPE
jgi:hypothetical protein